MATDPKSAEPEQAAPPIVAALFTEFIPNVKSDYGLLEGAGDGPLKISVFDLQMETLIFALHCLDRAVLAHCGAAYRSAFMDTAFASACGAFAVALPNHARDQFIKSFKHHWHTRQREYGEMKLLPSEGEALKGVLAYEYAKRICFDAGVHDPAVVLAMVEGANDIFSMANKIAQTLQAADSSPTRH